MRADTQQGIEEETKTLEPAEGDTLKPSTLEDDMALVSPAASARPAPGDPPMKGETEGEGLIAPPGKMERPGVPGTTERTGVPISGERAEVQGDAESFVPEAWGSQPSAGPDASNTAERPAGAE